MIAIVLGTTKCFGCVLHAGLLPKFFSSEEPVKARHRCVLGLLRMWIYSKWFLSTAVLVVNVVANHIILGWLTFLLWIVASWWAHFVGACYTIMLEFWTSIIIILLGVHQATIDHLTNDHNPWEWRSRDQNLLHNPQKPGSLLTIKIQWLTIFSAP